MFQRFHKMREEREGGFTLIELLVVILIIAILAAIAIPVFLAQRKKGWNGQVQSGLKNAATAIESFATDNNGDYTGADLAALTAEGLKTAPAVTIAVTAATATDYCLTATHADLGAGDDWATATYDSDEGEPQDADTC
jgi:prepilin-type N-terminal cleavage/methylation domain-containing protein